MIIPVTKQEIGDAKRQVKDMLKNIRITLKKLSEHDECPVGYQTVKEALNTDIPYWNQDVVNLAFKMVEEKKKALEELQKEMEETKQSLITK